MFKRNVISIVKATLCAALLFSLFTAAYAQRRPALRELMLAHGETVVIGNESITISGTNGVY